MKHHTTRAAALLAALALSAASALAAPPQQGTYTGMIEYVEPMEGPWLTLLGAEGRRVFYCGDFAGDCERWMCRDLGRRLTVRYAHVAEVLADGEPFEADTLTRIDGPLGPVDAELGRVRCAAQGMVAGAQTPEGPAAANSLGVWYEKGKHGLPKDPEIAAYWYGQAAHYGNALAMHNQGDLYRQGKGVPQDGGEAFRWYKKAAEAGHAIGLEDMADCYLKGIGVEANRAEALRRYREAAPKGRKSAAQKLRELGADTEPGAGRPLKPINTH